MVINTINEIIEWNKWVQRISHQQMLQAQLCQ
jgi:hypothetical protein